MHLHPFKTDVHQGYPQTTGNNLCEEIAMPTSAYSEKPNALDNVCRLGMSDSLADYISLSNHIHMMQVYAKFRILIGHSKVINSFYSGATPDQLMPALDVEALALKLISEHEGELTQLDNVLGALTSTYLQESIQFSSSLAVNNSLKERQLMQATSNVLSKLNPAGDQSDNVESRCGTKVPAFHDEIPTNFKLPDGGFKPSDISSIGTVTSEGVSKLASFLESVDGAKAQTKLPKLKSLEQVRKPKRKKSKPKSRHIPNMNNRSVKRALGATILMKLGQVQRDTMDTYKRAMLKELPAADLLEMATGEKLPDYQANLINNMQAKADPSAPVVERMVAGGIPLAAAELDKCINSDELFPENTSQEDREVIVEKAKEHFGRGLTNVLVHYDDGAELTNAQRQALLEEREGIVSILLNDGNTIKFTLDADDPDPAGTVEQIQKIYLTERDYNTDVYAAKHLATAESASFAHGESKISFFGGVDRKDVSFTNGERFIVVSYEEMFDDAIELLGCPVETLESIICNLDFWMSLRKDLCGDILPNLETLFKSVAFKDLAESIKGRCVQSIIDYVANNA